MLWVGRGEVRSSIGEALNETSCTILKIDQTELGENLDAIQNHGEGCGEERHPPE